MEWYEEKGLVWSGGVSLPDTPHKIILVGGEIAKPLPPGYFYTVCDRAHRVYVYVNDFDTGDRVARPGLWKEYHYGAEVERVVVVTPHTPVSTPNVVRVVEDEWGNKYSPTGEELDR